MSFHRGCVSAVQSDSSNYTDDDFPDLDVEGDDLGADDATSEFGESNASGRLDRSLVPLRFTVRMRRICDDDAEVERLRAGVVVNFSSARLDGGHKDHWLKTNLFRSLAGDPRLVAVPLLRRGQMGLMSLSHTVHPHSTTDTPSRTILLGSRKSGVIDFAFQHVYKRRVGLFLNSICIYT